MLQDVLNDLSGTPRPIEVKLFGDDYAALRAQAREVAGAHRRTCRGLVDLYTGLRGRRARAASSASIRRAAARAGHDRRRRQRRPRRGLARRGRVVDPPRPTAPIGVRVRYPDAIRFDRPRRSRAAAPRRPGGGDRRRRRRRAERTTRRPALMRENLRPVVILTADHEAAISARSRATSDRGCAGLALPEGYDPRARRPIPRAAGHASASSRGVLAFGLLARARGAAGAVPPRAARPGRARVGPARGGRRAADAARRPASPLNASSLMGCVLLVGLVVKNGILLLEQAESLWRPRRAAGRRARRGGVDPRAPDPDDHAGDHRRPRAARARHRRRRRAAAPAGAGGHGRLAVVDGRQPVRDARARRPGLSPPRRRPAAPP